MLAVPHHVETYGVVEAGERVQVRLPEPGLVAPQGGKSAGRQRQLRNQWSQLAIRSKLRLCSHHTRRAAYGWRRKPSKVATQARTRTFMFTKCVASFITGRVPWMEHTHVPARHGLGAGPKLCTMQAVPAAVSNNCPARLCLPVVVNDRHSHVLLSPGYSVRV